MDLQVEPSNTGERWVVRDMDDGIRHYPVFNTREEAEAYVLGYTSGRQDA